MSDEMASALPYIFDFWALPHQRPPEGKWRNWLILGGRGAGKTRAGAEWVRAMVEGPSRDTFGEARQVALVGDTLDQVREVMIFGDSGIMNIAPPWNRPEWVASRQMLIWPNGATARVCSARAPESLRGPQFDAAWLDELAKWPKAEAAWDMLQFALRLGERPRACITTTPRSTPLVRQLLESDTTAITRAPTQANAANLAPGFMEEMARRYVGTRLGRQELDGVLLSDPEGALWPLSMLNELIVDQAPTLSRIVVAVDPPVTGHKGSDACGIVVAGMVKAETSDKWQAFVLEDASVAAASPLTWAKAAVEAFERHGADRLVAEVNQGGEMVETILRQIAPNVPYRAVHASRGKVARAEPVAALYEQGRVHHLRGLDLLEDQMGQMSHRGYDGTGSPDRVDALVWALTELMIAPNGGSAPRIRTLG